jgi:hypothetical protein
VTAMSDPHRRDVGYVEDDDRCCKLTVGIDHNSVTLGKHGAVLWHLDPQQAEEFAQLFVRACWEAARQDGAP